MFQIISLIILIKVRLWIFIAIYRYNSEGEILLLCFFLNSMSMLQRIESMNWLSSQRIAMLITVVAVLFMAVHSIAFFSATDYMPADPDETIFYNSARNFFVNTSVKSVTMQEELTARIGGANWYGPAYSLLYGIPAKLFGFGNKYWIFFNFIFIVAALFVISMMPVGERSRWFYAAVLLLFNVTQIFVFTWNPEIFNLLLGLILCLFLFRIAESGRGKWLFVLLCFLFSFFRITWIFWAAGLLPFMGTRRKQVLYGAGFVFMLMLAFAYVQLFCAPFLVTAGGIGKELATLHFGAAAADFVKTFARNVYYFFYRELMVTPMWFAVKMVFIFLLFMLLHSAWRRRNRLVVSAAMIVMISLLVLFGMYQMTMPYVMKITGSLVLLVFFVTLRTGGRQHVAAILISLLWAFPFAQRHAIVTIKAHVTAAERMNNDYRNMVAALRSIPALMDHNTDQYVMFADYELQPMPFPLFLCILPVSDGRGHLIRYTANRIDPRKPVADTYKFFDRLPVKFIISRTSLIRPDLELLEQNAYFSFYHRKAGS